MKLIYSILIAFVLTNCMDLTEKPKGLLLTNNISNYNNALTGAYASLYNYWGGGFDAPHFWIATGGADDVYLHAIYAPFENLAITYARAINTSDHIWRTLYTCIVNCNKIQAYIPADATNREQIVGQAQFLRAFCYFYLVRFWGKVPLIDETNYINAFNVAQVENELEIYEKIIKDLQDAENKLPASFPEKGRATKWAAKTLLTKVYLTMTGWPIKDDSKYALARDKAEEVMYQSGHALHYPFIDLWKSENKLTNKEFIFTFFGSSSPSVRNSSHLHLATRPEKGNVNKRGGELRGERGFYNDFPSGPRKEGTFVHTYPDGITLESLLSDRSFNPHIIKFRDAGSGATFEGEGLKNDGDGFFAVLRFADVLLMYAEASNGASADANAPAEAYKAINRVRSRAGLSDLQTNLTKEQFQDAVIAERHWELAFELNRWFDLIRTEKLAEAWNKHKDADKHKSLTERKFYLLPKPVTQVTISVGKLKQTPGY